MDEEEHCIVIESKFDANSIQSDAEFWKNKYLQLEKKNASVKKELEGIKDTLTTHTVMLQKLLKRAYPFSPKLEEKIFPLMSMEHLEKVEEMLKRKPKADVMKYIAEIIGKYPIRKCVSLLFSPEFMMEVNWDGDQNKKSLKDKNLFRTYVFDVVKSKDFGYLDYEKAMRHGIRNYKNLLYKRRKKQEAIDDPLHDEFETI